MQTIFTKEESNGKSMHPLDAGQSINTFAEGKASAVYIGSYNL